MPVSGLPDVPFRARPPWWGRHLQTLRNALRGVPEVRPFVHRRIYFPLDDGTGDRLPGLLQRPGHACTDAPLLLMVHGLGGCESSAYLRAASAFALQRGWSVLRLNLRGSVPARATCQGWSHAGQTEDLRAVMPAIANLAGEGALFAMAFSLGGNLLLKYLGEGEVEPRLHAAVSVSAPLDLLGAARLIEEPRNRLYDLYLLNNVRAAYLYRGTSLPPDLRQAAKRARTLYRIDDQVTAPLNGFADAQEYYRKASCLPHLRRIRLPTLMIHGVDDPFVPAAPYEDLIAKPSVAEAVKVLLPEGGGHVGFHDRHGLWHLRQATRFFESVAGL